MKKIRAMAVITIVAGIAPAWAELQVEQVQKLFADDGAYKDAFGLSVSVDGDTAVIGASGNDDNGRSSGSAYVFTRSGGVWTQQAKLLPADGATEDAFGFSVSVDGDTAVIGAHGDDSNGSDSGSACVFTRSGDVWTQQARLLAEDGATDDEFGRAVAVSGDTVVIGARFDDDRGPRSGSAYVFTRSGEIWTQQAKLLADDGAPADFLGVSVAVDGDTAIIGADYDDDNADESGAAYVFARSGDTWAQQAKLLAHDGNRFDRFGFSVAVHGDTGVIGSLYGDDDNGAHTGAVYVFTRTNGLWTQQAKLLAEDGAPFDLFGISVAVHDNTVAVGATNDNGDYIGSAYLFTRADRAWKQQAKLLHDDRMEADGFGFSVSLEDDTVVIGAAGGDSNAPDSGSAYVFRIRFDPIDSLTALAAQVRSLGLPHGTENSLLATLDAAVLILTDIGEDNDHAAANLLGAFINQVEGRNGTKIPAADAERLIRGAQGVLDGYTDRIAGLASFGGNGSADAAQTRNSELALAERDQVCFANVCLFREGNDPWYQCIQDETCTIQCSNDSDCELGGDWKMFCNGRECERYLCDPASSCSDIPEEECEPWSDWTGCYDMCIRREFCIYPEGSG